MCPSLRQNERRDCARCSWCAMFVADSLWREIRNGAVEVLGDLRYAVLKSDRRGRGFESCIAGWGGLVRAGRE